MVFRLSNTILGVLNALSFLLSIPILAGGIWLAARGDGTECQRDLAAPAIALGAFLMVVSLAGLFGACCRINCLLWFYLVAMFLLIVVLFCCVVFALVFTSKGAGEAVPGRRYKEYRLGDYSTWLQKKVENWTRTRSCLQEATPCKSLQDKNETFAQFIQEDLSPIESGCCKPPTSCQFEYVGGTVWKRGNSSSSSTDPDCNKWSNDASALCYGCQSCKAGVVATYKKDSRSSAVVNVVTLVVMVIVYSVAICAFRNNRRDNAYRAGWKEGGQAS